MARARGSFRRSSGPRPNRSWAYTQETTYTTIPASTKVLLASFVPTAAGVDSTFLRAVGLLSIGSDQSATQEDQIGAFGIIIVTDKAIAAGVASIPGPFTDGDDDGWFVHQSFFQRTQLVATMNPTVQYVIDSKAKRILEGKGMALALVGENGGASHGVLMGVQLRLLDQVRGTR